MQENIPEPGPIKPFDYGNETFKTRRNLPHWQQNQVTYFVTFRLADSIPVEKIRKWKNDRDIWLEHHQQPFTSNEWQEYHELFSTRINKMLDSGSGACILRCPEVRSIVKDALLFFDGKRYVMGSWVIMPNHIHLIVTPINNYSLTMILQSWKSFTAKNINSVLSQTGPVWQRESYDHIIRSVKQLQVITDYILKNPEKAKLLPTDFSVSES